MTPITSHSTPSEYKAIATYYYFPTTSTSPLKLMCQGKQQQANSPDLAHHHQHQQHSHELHTGSSAPLCELCGSDASLYCQADRAYLCWKCDQWVHGANFLANRHIRWLLNGSTSPGSTQGYFAGSLLEVVTTPMTIVGLKRSRAREDDSSGSTCDGHQDDGVEIESPRSSKMPYRFL